MANASFASTLRVYAVKLQHSASPDLASVCCGDPAYLDSLPPVDGPYGSLLAGLDVDAPFEYHEPVRGGASRGCCCLLRRCFYHHRTAAAASSASALCLREITLASYAALSSAEQMRAVGLPPDPRLTPRRPRPPVRPASVRQQFFRSNWDSYEILYGPSGFGQALRLTPSLSDARATAQFDVEGAPNRPAQRRAAQKPLQPLPTCAVVPA